MADPPRQLPRAVYLALGIATLIYVAVALGVFGTLTVDEVIDSGGTALAVAAEPVLGQAGYWLMTVTALFATAGATNAGLYPAAGLSEHLASIGQFPPLLARRFGGRAPAGLLVTAVFSIILARRLRPQRDRLDRERGGARDLRARRDRPHADPGADGRERAGPRSRASSPPAWSSCCSSRPCSRSPRRSPRSSSSSSRASSSTSSGSVAARRPARRCRAPSGDLAGHLPAIGLHAPRGRSRPRLPWRRPWKPPFRIYPLVVVPIALAIGLFWRRARWHMAVLRQRPAARAIRPHRLAHQGARRVRLRPAAAAPGPRTRAGPRLRLLGLHRAAGHDRQLPHQRAGRDDRRLATRRLLLERR